MLFLGTGPETAQSTIGESALESMKKFTPVLAVLVSVSLLSARQEQRSCASHADKWREELRLHQQSQAALAKVKLALATKAAAAPRPDIGNIAHLGDADGVIAQRNLFNLNGRTIRFLPSADWKTYRYEVGEQSYDTEAATNGALLAGIEDDDSREATLPFSFPFFGAQWNSVFINSDGNVTFGRGDSAITDRSLGRFLAGPPRLAGLFTDLDPRFARDGIKVLSDSNRFVISWSQVPEYRDSGNGPIQTFQMRLYRDGKIEYAFLDTRTNDSIVGITPGNLQGEPNLVAFLNGTNPGASPSAIVERFSGSESVDIFTAAQKFYKNHEDAYDYLVVYNTLGIAADTSAVAYEVTVRNQRSGYGDPKTDVGAQAGSKRRLQAILNMGPLNQYPRDPNGRVQARLSVGDTPLSVIAHETGHLFLAYASIRDERGNLPMLGHQGAHWDFKFNSEASLMEGNRIKDNGVGISPRFQTTGTVEGFSLLDQYLMGFLPSENVPDTFYVVNSPNSAANGLPRVGVAFDGERRDVRIQDVIAAAGRRTPDHTVSQRQFRFAFALVTREGETPTSEQLAQLDDYRTQFEAYFRKVTSETATADTVLRRAVHASSFPAVGVMQGASVPVTISLEQATTEATTFTLKTGSGSIQAPASVVIPRGSDSATFQITGLAEGVTDLVVEAPNAGYNSVASRVQVLPAGKLRLSPLSQSSPVRLKITDSNELPYPGVTVQARAVGGGSLDKASAVSDSDGIVQFQWALEKDSDDQQLVANVPSGPSVTIDGGTRPVFAATGVLNAASFAPGLTPGGISVIFGARLGGGNARVLVNGQTAQLLFGNDGQLNFVVPEGLTTGTAAVLVQTGNSSSSTIQVPVLPTQPGIFFDYSSNIAAATVVGTGQLTIDRPVRAGEYLEIYCTGLGAVRQLESGLRASVITPEVMIGGAPAEVVFSGLAPAYFGLYQVNVKVPSGIASGTQPVVISSQGVRSNESRIRVQ